MTDPISVTEQVDDFALDDEAIHGMFGLTYANYLVLPRSILQAMPGWWQRQFVDLMDQYEDAARDHLHGLNYAVTCRDSEGRFIRDPIPHYRRGRTRVELHSIEPKHD